MKLYINFIKIHFLYASIGLLVFIGCTNTTPSKKTNTSDTDSIETWIQQSKSRRLTREQRMQALKKAYEESVIKKVDSEKIKYFSKIAIEAELLNSDVLFKEVNFKNLSLAIKLQDTFKIGDAHWNYGSYYQKKEVIDSAYYHYHKAYESFKVVKHPLYTANMLYNLGFIQGRIKDYTGAEISLYEAIAIFNKLNRPLNLYRCYNYLGIIYNNLEEFDRSIYYHNKALEYLEQVEENRKGTYREWSLSNIGLVYQKQKDYKRAIYHFEKALNNSNLKLRDIHFYARLKDNIAYTHFLSGDTLNLKEDLKYPLFLRDSLHYISGIVISKRHLSEFFAFKFDTVKAVKLATEAFALAEQVDNNRDELETLLLLSKVDKKKSAKYLAEYVHLNDSLQIEERKTRNKFTRIRFETDEYIEETEKLSQERILISVGAIFVIAMLSFAYFLRVQTAKNKELVFEREQQKSNEEIFSLMLKQQSKLEEGRMKERHRISADLHDGVLGKIFGTRLGLGFLDIKGGEETIEKHQSYIDELQHIEKEIRAISHELKNEILSSKEDFFIIIEDLINKKSELGTLKYTFDYDKSIDWDEINDAIKINYYRILQEALQNIIKYAKATEVAISIELEESNINLKITDNGSGFNLKSKRKGIGLKNMLSRTNNIHGIFKINSKISKGTTIFVSSPLQKSKYE